MTSADMTGVLPTANSADNGGAPGSRLIGTALVLLFVLGLGLLAVSYAAQYRYIAGQRLHQEVASAIEAGCLDVGLCILSLLALGLARRGLSSAVERALVVMTALGSAGMNYAAADVSSPRSVVAYCMPPVFLAIVVDRTVATVRRHILGMRDGRSPWAAFGRAVLYALRFLAAPVSTLLGLRRALLQATPLPGRADAPPSVPAPVGPYGPGRALSVPPARPVTVRSVPPPAAPYEGAGGVPVRGEPVRDARSGQRAGSDVDREALVAELAAGILGDPDWRPDYRALQERTGCKRSYCEKVVRDARHAAARTRAEPGAGMGEPVRSLA